MKLLSFVAASAIAVSAMAGNVDSQVSPLKSISLLEMEQVTGNTPADFSKMAQNTLYSTGNFLMQLGSDVIVDAGYQSWEQVKKLVACPSAQMDENFGYDLKYEPLKQLQRVVNGRENGRTSPITGIVASLTGCAVNFGAETFGLLAINTGDRLVDLVAIPGQLGHDIRVIAYKRAGKFAKVAVRTKDSQGNPVGLQLDLRVVAVAAGMPDTALMAAGGLAELSYDLVKAGNEKVWKVAVNGAVTGIDMGVRTAAFIVDIPVVRAVALAENGIMAGVHLGAAALDLAWFIISGDEASADGYVSHRKAAAKSIFYSIGSVISGRNAEKIDEELKKAFADVE